MADVHCTTSTYSISTFIFPPPLGMNCIRLHYRPNSIKALKGGNGTHWSKLGKSLIGPIFYLTLVLCTAKFTKIKPQR